MLPYNVVIIPPYGLGEADALGESEALGDSERLADGLRDADELADGERDGEADETVTAVNRPLVKVNAKPSAVKYVPDSPIVVALRTPAV